MLMPASSEFVALCQKQVGLLAQGMGAAFSVVYLTEELTEDSQTKLIPVVAYPERSVVWEENHTLALLPAKIQTGKNFPRLLSPAPTDTSMLPEWVKNPQPGKGQQEKEDNTLLQQRQIVLPLIHEEVVMGLLVTGREDRPWNEQEKAQIERIAHTMAIACILDQRSQWFEHQFRQQQLLQSQQNDLLHNLLHQLRNPMTALRTFGKLLLKRLRSEDANRDIANNILLQSDRMQELLQQFDGAIDLTGFEDDSLDIFPVEFKVEGETKVETPNQPSGDKPLLLLPGTQLMRVENLEPCSIEAILEPLLASAGAIAQERNLVFQADIPAFLPPVLGNTKALGEVFSNLIDNALKYTPSGGKVYIQANLERQSPQGKYRGIAVSDTGPGIPPQDLVHLFERHYRGVQANTAIPGTGLGLAIARDLVQQMQGEIQVFSPAHHAGAGGIGATFMVWLREI